MPNNNLTIPLNALGTFLTTIVISYVPPFPFMCPVIHQHASHNNPTIIRIAPIINNHPANGSSNTSNIPIPKPIKQTPKVFFKKHNIIHYLHIL